MIPQELTDIVNVLKTTNLDLPKSGTDGRADSTDAEKLIIKKLEDSKNQHGYEISSPNEEFNRAWYDVKIAGFYCDIKVSTMKAFDNTNRKPIYYFLTGEEPKNWGDKELFENMKENENADEERDYFYIVINKNDIQDIFIVSLKGIADARPNPRNPPFQCNWDHCRIPTQRDWEEAKIFLLSHWAESIHESIESLKSGMPSYYPEFFK